jgi:hypothetical protein
VPETTAHVATGDPILEMIEGDMQNIFQSMDEKLLAIHDILDERGVEDPEREQIVAHWMGRVRNAVASLLALSPVEFAAGLAAGRVLQ